jgi:hypothetical protein
MQSAYQVNAKVNGSAFSVVVETAKDALGKLAEPTDLGHAEVVAHDLFGKVIDPSILETEADAR